METVKSVIFDREERQAFREAALAQHVGDPRGERESGPFTGLIRDASPVSEARLVKVQGILDEILAAVVDERDLWVRARASLKKAIEENPEPKSNGGGVAIIADPLQGANVIIEARDKFGADLKVVQGIIESALWKVRN